MPFDAAEFLDNPEVGWDSLSRVEKARGREALFEAYVRSEPDLARSFAAADDATRGQYFSGFVEALQGQYPEKFATAVVTPAAAAAAAKETEQRRKLGGFASRIYGQDERMAPYAALADAPEVEAERTPVPILDPASEERLEKLLAGEDAREVDDDTLARLGPFALLLDPKRGAQLQSEAGVRLVQRGITAEKVAAQGFGQGLTPFTGYEERRPRDERRAEFEQVWQQRRAEAERAGPDAVATVERERQQVFEWFDNEPLARFGYEGVAEAFRPIGTTAAMAVGGTAGARMLQGVAGVQPLTRAGVAANALLVDAPMGALYAKTAPGFLSGLAARVSGREDLEGNEVLNAIENAGIGFLFGAALRQGAIEEMMDYARRHLGFAGESVRDFRAWADEMGAARAKGVHTEPVSRQIEPEAAPGAGAPEGTPPAGPAPAGSSADAFLARREAITIPDQMVQGGSTTVLGARGLELPAVYVYAPRGLVQASHVGDSFARNPAYPLENTRDYGNFAEQEKVLGVRNAFDVRRHVTDSPDAAVGPAVIAHVIDEQGASRLAVLGGNNREMAISMLGPEKARELDEYTASRAGRFGLPEPEAGKALYRFVGDYDLRQEGTREKLQGIIDALNPAPGKVQNLSEQAGVDAGNNVSLPRLQAAEMNMAPARAQEFVRGLIRDGSIDRNLRSAFAESPPQAQAYVNHLLLHGAYKIPSLVEARMDTRAGEVGIVRAMVDAGVPAALTLRGLGRDDIADAIGRTFYQVARQAQGGKVRLPKILGDLARQGDIDPAMRVVQNLAEAIGRKVALDKKGAVRVDETAAGVETLMDDIARALSLQGREPDLFGQVPDAAETMRRAIQFHFDRLEPAADVVAEPIARARPMAGAERVPGYVEPREDLPVERRPMAPANYVGRWDPGVPGIAPIEYFALRTPDGGITHTTAPAIQRMGYYLPEQLPAAREWTGAGDSAGVELVDDREGRIAERELEKAEYKRLAARLKALRDDGRKRRLSTVEYAEIDAIERSLGQQFMAFYTPREAAPAQPSTRRGLEDPRQMSLFDEQRHYREQETQAYQQLGADLDLPNGDADGGSIHGVFHAGGAGAAGGPSRRGTAGAERIGPGFVLRGLAYDRRLIQDGKVRFVGQDVAHVDDLVRLAQTLRNPKFETFYLIPTKAGQVLPPYAVTSRLPGQSKIYAEGDDIHAFARYLTQSGADGYYLLHNHPSGDPKPSTLDQRTTAHVARQLAGSGHGRFLGHVVIDHFRYSLLTTVPGGGVSVREVVLPENQALPDQLLTPEMPHEALGAQLSPHTVALLGTYFRGNNPGRVSVALVDYHWKVQAVLEMDRRMLSLPDIARHLARAGKHLGGSWAIAYADAGDAAVDGWLRALIAKGVLHDAVIGAGALGGSRQVTGGTFDPRATVTGERVQEPGAGQSLAGKLEPVDEAPEAHVWYASPAAAGRASTFLPIVFRDLDKIRSIEMPEIVQLAETLMGKIPRIRRLPKAMGVFTSGGTGRISLDPRIFVRSDVATRVLAHELGHLADYLPDRTLARGNLLGRIATLRNYMRQTLDLKPGGGRGLTAIDRRNLRRRAEKDAGTRPPETNAPALKRWQDDVKQRYAKLLENEIRIRGLTTNEQVFAELWEVSQWWHPVPANVPQSYLDYRQSAAELYADAISVLFNSPADLMERAPTFWKTWFDYLDRKPEVKQAFFELQDLLQKPYREVLAVRKQRVQGMFVRGEERLMRAWEEREALRGIFRGFWDRVKTEVHDVYWPIIRRARAVKASGRAIAPKWDPEYVFGDHPLADNQASVFAQRVHEKVVAPMEAAGIGTEQLGRYMFYNRVLNEVLPDRGDLPGGRAQLANPLGETPETARLALLTMRLELGLPKMEALEGWARRFQDLVYDHVEEAVALGNYPAAALETLKKNRHNYATFAVLDFFEPYVPPGIRRQKGTLQAIANPFTATLLKGLSMIRANEVQRAKLTAVKLLRDFFPAELRELAKPGERPRPGEKKLVLNANGRPVFFAAPAEVVDMFEGVTPANASAVVGALNWSFRTVIYPLWITYNPAFQLLTSPIRDIQRAAVNLPRGAGFRLIAEYLANLGSLTLEAGNAVLRGAGVPLQVPVPMTEAAAAARAILGQGTEPGRAPAGSRGVQDPAGLAREMMLNSAVGTPYDSFATHHRRGDSLGQIMQQLRLLPAEPRNRLLQSKIVQPALKVLKAIEFAGITNELLAKTAAYKILAKEMGWTPQEAADFVRNNVGVPNIHKQGRHIRLLQAVFPFFNVFQKGLAADWARATGSKSAAGWWVRWAAISGMPNMLKALAKVGLFGAAVKLLYDRISDYDATNYLVLPVGEVDGGDYGQKTVYVRIPQDETHRIMSGLVYKAITAAAGEPGAEISDMLAFGSGQVPGLNPLLSIGSKWTQYLAGTSPRDDFRDRDILAPQVQRAGGLPALQGMLLWTYNETGLANFVKLDPQADTFLEYSLMTAPGVNRILKVSDYGLRERQFDEILAEQAARDRERLKLSDEVRRTVGEYYTLRSLGDKRTLEQDARYSLIRAWYLKSYRPQEEALFDMLEVGDAAAAGEVRRGLDESAAAIREVIRER